MRKIVVWILAGSIVAGMSVFGVCVEEKAKPKIKVYKEWDFTKSGEADEWQEVPKNNLEIIDTDKCLKMEALGMDPFIFFPESAAGFSAEEYPFIIVKARATQTTNATHQIYFGTEDNPNLGEDKVVIMRLKKGQEITNIDMRKCKNWKGTITTLRLDPFNGPEESGCVMEIEFIKIASGPME